MTPITFLYELLKKFLTIPKAEIIQMENEANQWAEKVTEQPNNAISRWYAKYANTWYVRTFFAAIFLFAVRWVQDFMNPVYEDDIETEI